MLRTLILLLAISNFCAAQEMGLPVVPNQDVQFYRPVFGENAAELNRTMEVGFRLDDKVNTAIKQFKEGYERSINPYDPMEIDVYVLLTSPSGKITRQNAFYYEDFRIPRRVDKFLAVTNDLHNWRLRFAPDEVGEWKAILKVNSAVKRMEKRFEFTVKPSNSKGRLTTTQKGTDADRYLTFKQSGETFFTVGENISSGGFLTFLPSQMQSQLDGIERLAEMGANFTRFEMSAQGPLPDYLSISDYSEKQDEMYAFDRVMQLAEDKEMYAILFRHHVEVKGADWDLPNWKNNPYRKHFKLEKPSDYFTNEELRRHQKNSLRYQMARWGYSPFFAFYGYSEVDNWILPMVEDEGLTRRKAAEIFGEWFLDQKEYMISINPDMLYVNSYAGVPDYEIDNPKGLLEASDIIAVHFYGEGKGINFDQRARTANNLYRKFKRPILLEEMGVAPDRLTLYCCSGIEFKSAIWSSTFMGHMGSGLEWWWNRGVHDFNHLEEMRHLHKHVANIDYAGGEFYPQMNSDEEMKRRTWESYCLVGDSGKTVVGWVKNSTVYWRNLAASMDCYKQLVENGVLDFNCVSDDKLHVFHNNKGDYTEERFVDEYTQGGPLVLGSNDNLDENPELVVNDLPWGFWRKNRQWYKVDFYSTDPNVVYAPQEEYRQIVKTNIFGKLKFHTPKMDENVPDYAFKIVWLGQGKEAPILESR